MGNTLVQVERSGITQGQEAVCLTDRGAALPMQAAFPRVVCSALGGSIGVVGEPGQPQYLIVIQ